MKKFLSSLIDSTDREVETHLVLLCCGVATFLVLSVYHVVIMHATFEPSSYGEGFGYLLAGGGAAAWGQGLQRKAEKGDSDEPGQ